ncbi:alpha/beta hydrolase [Mesoaciditoga sp.]
MESALLENEGQKIFAVIHDAGKDTPVVVMFHGFTGNHIENRFIFAKMSRELEKVGISSIRFDFRGSGDSEGTFEEMTLSSEMSDAKVVTAYARKRFSKKLGVLGLSMGGTVALLTAKDIAPDALCLWAPAAKNAEVFTKGGMPPSSNENLDVGGLAISPKFIEEIMKFDAFSKAQSYDGPVLILHGTEDPTVPFVHSKELVNEFKNAELVPVEGANHTFTSIPWAKFVMNKTKNFFLKLFCER